MGAEEPCSHQSCEGGSVARSDELRNAFHHMIHSIPGENSRRDGLLDTPQRAAESFTFLTQGYQLTAQNIIGNAIFQSDSKEMVLVKSIDVYSLCEHHLLPFFGTVHVAYLPNEGRVVGLSKIPRLVNMFAQRLQIQERLTQQIGEALQEVLEPLGVAVIMECRHMCMEMRGVKSNSSVTRTRFRCGLFDTDPQLWMELQLVLAGSVPQEWTGSFGCRTPGTLSTAPSSLSLSQSNHAFQETPETSHISVGRYDGDREAEDYRLYQSCAENEFEQMANTVLSAVSHPLTGNQKGLSLLDIGAGNGRLLESLISKLSIKSYSAFEDNKILYEELTETASKLVPDDKSRFIRNITFSVETSLDDAGGCSDIVLLSHSLYYTSTKEELVHHALRFVAPGGVLLIFHRWTPNGTIQRLSTVLNSSRVLHSLQIFRANLDLRNLSGESKKRVLRYSKVHANGSLDYVTVRRACLAIEPGALNGSAAASRKVSYEARHKTPATVIVPHTVIGIQACLRAASLGVFGSNKLTVVGGGHSANCYADNAIVIDMQMWNHVVVDPSSSSVRVGGGATIGDITVECEKHGLMVPLGDRPSVGMGLILQGGLNHLMRFYGLACDNILRVEYVAPTGEISAAKSEEELFPFRGAGPNFGVVLEVTMKAHKVDSILTRSIDYYVSSEHELQDQILLSYSDGAMKVPENLCLDGFLYWSGSDQLVFATSSFDINPQQMSDEHSRIDEVLPANLYNRRIQEPWTRCKASDLFDRELYMTERFHPSHALAPGQETPEKLRSLKRCLLFPPLDIKSGAALMEIVRAAPTKCSYVHFLHGGGVARDLDPTASAFGCRNWVLAAVITGRYPDGDAELQAATVEWLETATRMLKPYAAGVYGADLGPADSALARYAFGDNSRRLAQLKRMRDPLNILSCSCPLLGGSAATSIMDSDDVVFRGSNNDPRFEESGVVVIFCGRRFVGKDWLAKIVQSTLREMLGGCSSEVVSLIRISDTMKRAYAADQSHALSGLGIDAERLIHDRTYKELHRPGLIQYYEACKAENVAYDAQCFVQTIHREFSSGVSLLLLTGLRDGLSYVQGLAGRPVVLVKVEASNESKKSRGWSYNAVIDESTGELAAETQPTCFGGWDAVYQNDSDSTTISAKEWVKHELTPVLVKRCVRHIPNTPRSGIVYKDLVGGILRQPFGLSLTTALLCNKLTTTTCEIMDAIVAPEATGFLFAAPVAERLGVPLIPFRKSGKLFGDVSSICYQGSNISNLEHGSLLDKRNCFLEAIDGSIQPGQHVVVLDDCLASGRTATAMVQFLVGQKRAVVRHVICVAELPDLKGRDALRNLGVVHVSSLMQFQGE